MQVHYSFIYFPVFYVFKETIQGSGYEKTVASVFGAGLSKYKDNAFEDNPKMWALWIPGDLIVYSVPMWLRLPCNHGFSFVWTCYLSFLRGGDTLDDGEVVGNGEEERGSERSVALHRRTASGTLAHQ